MPKSMFDLLVYGPYDLGIAMANHQLTQSLYQRSKIQNLKRGRENKVFQTLGKEDNSICQVTHVGILSGVNISGKVNSKFFGEIFK